MRSRAVRWTLTLLAVSALGTAAYLAWNIERRSTTVASNAKDVAWRLDAAARHALELRAAQQAYVAIGQSDQFWTSKVTDSITGLQETLAAVRTTPLSVPTVAALDRAAQAIDEFTRLDRRARSYASTDQRLLASDLIFSDGLEGTQQILAALDEARNAEARVAAAAIATSKRELAAVAGGGAAVALLALLLLTSPGKPREAEKSLLAASPITSTRPEGEGLPKRVLAPPVPARAQPKLTPQVLDVADVCTQLARVSDTSTLPTVLQRTAVALDATGVVLWITDPDGVELLPVATHGYSPAMLSQMGPIPRGAANVTAAAFRTGLLQTVKGDATSNGAIAAPLVNTSGCVGVLSAEVRNDGDKEPARLALATIVAAQLATLTAPATRNENRAAL
jgi:hypothetical protein